VIFEKTIVLRRISCCSKYPADVFFCGKDESLGNCCGWVTSVNGLINFSKFPSFKYMAQGCKLSTANVVNINELRIIAQINTEATQRKATMKALKAKSVAVCVFAPISH
jgi:hypothetical protein